MRRITEHGWSFWDWQTRLIQSPTGRAHPYAPDGPWQYILPDHERDWRTRARASLQETTAFHTSEYISRVLSCDYIAFIPP